MQKSPIWEIVVFREGQLLGQVFNLKIHFFDGGSIMNYGGKYEKNILSIFYAYNFSFFIMCIKRKGYANKF